MRGSPENLAALRLLLAERFPQAAPRPAATLPTGVAAIDEAGDGGLPLGGITEVVALAPSTGGQLLISRLLAATRERRMRAALVDALDAFDPQSHEPPLLQHLVWVRCRTLDEAMHAADILVRDANLALVMVDLRGVAARALRGVPATTWYRLQRALERTDMAMVVFTAENRETEKSGNRETAGEIGNDDHAPFRRPADTADQSALSSSSSLFTRDAERPPAPLGLVGSARLRLTLAGSFQLDPFAEEQTRLAFRLPVTVQRRRLHDLHEERRIA
jgi:hypothetical protein